MGKAPVKRGVLLAVFIAIVCGFARLPIRAQNDTVPAEVTALFEDIADIDKLRILNPLKLSPEQIDKLIELIRKSKREYDSALAAAAVPPIKEMAKDIKETRRKMLGGAAIPKDLDEKVKKLQDSFINKRDQQDVNTLKSVAESTSKILTPSQKSKAASQARNALTQDGKPTAKGDDEKFFNFYILQVFIKYPRILPLLEDMKKTASSG